MSYLVKHEISVSDYNLLRDSVGWGKLKEEQAQRGLLNSQYIVSVYVNNEIMGTARVVGDGGYVALIVDVMVRKEYQKQGIGKMMLEDIMHYLENTISEHEILQVNLMAAKGKEKFYDKFGFEVRPNENMGAGMVKWYHG